MQNSIGLGPSFPASQLVGFSPAQLSGCKLWLRADLGVTLNGSTVSGWADQSGNGNNASQGTAANQPTYGAATGPSSRPGITFDGTNDYLVADAVASVFSGSDAPFTVVVSASIPAFTSTRMLWNAGNSASANSSLSLNATSSATQAQAIKIDDAAGNAVPFFTSQLADATWHASQLNCPGTTVTLRNNNTTSGSMAFDVATTTTNQFTVGARRGTSASAFTNATIWEVIVYNRSISGAESTLIYNYQLALGAAT